MSSSVPNSSPAPQTPLSQPSLPQTPESAELEQPQPGFGWTAYAERINGRFAMVGFITLLILEIFTHQDFLTWVGFR